MVSLKLEEVIRVGANRYGYTFCVGRIGDQPPRWIGFAAAKVDASTTGMFVFPEVSERFHMGVTDRDEAIRRTAAVAQDPESSYGGIDTWYVEERLRANPDDYRCARCDRVGCDGIQCQEDDYGCYDG